MVLPFLVKGLITGFAIASGVGPTTVLVVHRIVKKGFGAGILSGAGAAAADAVYGLLAGVGAGFVSGYITPHYLLVRLIGGIFLMYWGYRIFVSRFAESHPLVRGAGFGGPFISTAILTFSNPVTIFGFAAVLVAFRSSGLQHSPASLLAWTVGVGSGSLIWWLALSCAVAPYREKFHPKSLVWINRVIGFVVVAAGAWALADLVLIIAQVKL